MTLSSDRLATIELGAGPLATIARSTRPLGTIPLPLFPATLEEAQAGLIGADAAFLMGADGTILQGADA